MGVDNATEVKNNRRKAPALISSVRICALTGFISLNGAEGSCSIVADFQTLHWLYVLTFPTPSDPVKFRKSAGQITHHVCSNQ